MARPAVHNANAEPHQPGAEAGQRLAAAIAPRRTAIHQHGERQAIAAKGSLQLPAHRRSLFVAAGRKNEIVARAIVEHGERMAAPAVQGEVALEVHLPKLVRALALKAPPRPRMFSRSRVRQPVVTAQNRGDRARRRDPGLSAIFERPLDLPPAPSVVAALANFEHLRLNRGQSPQRARLRSARPFDETRRSFQPITLKPLVSSRPAHPEASAQTPDVRPFRRRKHHKLKPLIHHRHLPKRHPHPPDSLIGKVSTMSPNGCP
jgi:hypothetical protein